MSSVALCGLDRQVQVRLAVATSAVRARDPRRAVRSGVNSASSRRARHIRLALPYQCYRRSYTTIIRRNYVSKVRQDSTTTPIDSEEGGCAPSRVNPAMAGSFTRFARCDPTGDTLTPLAPVG